MIRNDPVHIGTYALRGAIAAMAMTGMRVVTVGLNLLPKVPPEEIFEDALPQFLELVPREYWDEAIELAHWGYGAVGGATFGANPDRQHRPAREPRRLPTGSGAARASLSEHEGAVLGSAGPFVYATVRRMRPKRPGAERSSLSVRERMATVVGHPAAAPDSQPPLGQRRLADDATQHG